MKKTVKQWLKELPEELIHDKMIISDEQDSVAHNLSYAMAIGLDFTNGKGFKSKNHSLAFYTSLFDAIYKAEKITYKEKFNLLTVLDKEAYFFTIDTKKKDRK
jgi:hypothetical protein